MHRHRLLLFLCAIVYALVGGAAALGQQMPFLFVPGGPTGISVLFEDHLGKLWVGGGSDVACFDGNRFYSLREFGLPAANTRAITEDEDGAIWIGSASGLYRFYDGALTEVMKGYVYSIASSAGVVLASVAPAGTQITSPSLYRIRPKGDGWVVEPVTGLHWPLAFTVDHAGTLLIPQKDGWEEAKIDDVVHWRNGEQVSVSRHEFKTPQAVWYLRDRYGCLWLRSGQFTDYQCPGDGERKELPEFRMSGRSMWEGPDGTMFFVNSGSIVMGRPGKFRTVSPAQGVPDVSVAIIAKDGTIWLGCANGIYRWAQPFRLEYWTARDGFAGRYRIRRLGNKIFAGNGQEGIAVLRDDRARWEPLPKSKSLGPVFDLLPDLHGGFFAVVYQGIAHVRGDGSEIARAGESSDSFGRLFRAPDGKVWAAGIRLCQVKQVGKRLVLDTEPLPAPNPPGMRSVNALNFDARTGAAAWLTWSGLGLLHKESSGWRSISTKDGLADVFCAFTSILPNGDLWTSYSNVPLFSRVRMDSSGKVAVKTFGPSRAGENAQVMFMGLDSRGWLWRGTGDGVYVADPSDAENNLWTRMDQVDGLPNVNSELRSFYDDTDGSVWWLERGANVVHFSPPSDFVRPTFAPVVWMSSFSWNGGAPHLADALKATPAGATITAHIGTLQFDRRNALRMRYRVLPEQTAWRESRDLDISLGVLGWGEHAVEVQGRVGTGPWSGTAKHGFEVLRPFWATWPFLIGVAVVGLGGGLGGYRWERRRKMIQQRRLPDLRALRADAMAPEAHGLIGNVLDGRFLAKRVLARGGFATVFDGLDKKQNRRCAIKVFHRDVADQGLAQRFTQEVAALESVMHRNVVRIYGHGETPQGVPYLVMEFVEGQTLREAIPENGFRATEVATLLREAGQALGAIHTHGICHRDLKPDNLMIRAESGELVLIDFSIAIVKSPDKTVHGLSKAAGTIQYMAPEQAAGWATSASDIYSLAKVTMEMITGKRVSELLPDASWDLAVRVREMLVAMKLGLSAESIELMRSALEFDPGRRPINAVAFADKIAGDLAGDSRSFNARV